MHYSALLTLMHICQTCTSVAKVQLSINRFNALCEYHDNHILEIPSFFNIMTINLEHASLVIFDVIQRTHEALHFHLLKLTVNFTI